MYLANIPTGYYNRGAYFQLHLGDPAFNRESTEYTFSILCTSLQVGCELGVFNYHQTVSQVKIVLENFSSIVVHVPRKAQKFDRPDLNGQFIW